MLKPAIAGVCLCAAATALAQQHDLSGPQITELVAGATVEIDTPAGTKVPVRYTLEGRVSGEARDLAWFLGSDRDIGRWWVAGDRLCHKWIRWFNGEPQCMRLAREGRTIRWLAQDGNSGTATIAVPAVAQASILSALPRWRPNRGMEAVPAETPPAPPTLAAPPAPAAPPVPASVPDARAPADAAKIVVRPSQQVAKETVAAVAAAPTAAKLPAPRPDTHPPPKQAEPKRPPVPQQAAPKRPAQPTFMVANVRPDDVLNVRSGPSADFDVIGELPPGSRGIAITSACRASWCPVQRNTTSGWVNSVYLEPEQSSHAAPDGPSRAGIVPPSAAAARSAMRDSPEAPRSCLTPAARGLLDRIEHKFGPVRVVSTCRTGATIAGTGQPSRHASGNAVDFDAGSRKAAIVEWLIATHRSGGTMTYADMDHIHVDIGPHFVSIANGRRLTSWRGTRRDYHTNDGD